MRVESDGVTEAFHEPEVGVQNVRPRPGDSEVAFVHDGSGFDGLYLLDVGEDPAAEPLFVREKAEVADPAWNSEGTRLAVTVTADAAANVWTVALNGEMNQLTDEPAFYTAPRYRNDNVLATGDAPQRPAAIHDVTAGDQLSPTAALGFDKRIPIPESLTYESAGRRIQAVVYSPPENAALGPVPVVVKAHGGPTSFDRYWFDFRSAYLAALGYCVIMPNYRGSDAYGREFRMANDHEWGRSGSRRRDQRGGRRRSSVSRSRRRPSRHLRRLRGRPDDG